MEIEFRRVLKEEFERFVSMQKERFPAEETLRIDLHCHDLNSDVPDELIGRILRVPETWLPSDRLMEKLAERGCDTFTVTNHNNARSCYALQDKGLDVLTGAEFSCQTPDFEIGIHVLAYGFGPEQEVRLEKLRRNLYAFLEYARRHEIPVIWAHPLYSCSTKRRPSLSFFKKMLLLFERFETLNGQRDTWQNMLVKEWLENVSRNEIDQYAHELGIDPLQYCSDPYRKSMSGGSDCHFGIFAGMTGTRLYVPDLRSRLTTESRSQLALEAIRKGDMAPFGTFQHTEKMTIAFLDYACQIALNYRDPGLMRMLLHKGSANDKLISLIVSNLFGEVRRHKATTSFIRIFHESIMGEKPSFLKKIIVKPAYKPVFDEAVAIADRKNSDEQALIAGYSHSVQEIYKQLSAILAKRLEKKMKKAGVQAYLENKSVETVVEKLELPSDIRAYIGNGGYEQGKRVDVSGFLDDLSFPFLGASLIMAAHFTSAKTMYGSRPLLNEFSKRLRKFEHPERILWLTDTFGDENEVSVFLKELHTGIIRKNLPIDIVTCSSTVPSGEHLIALRPVKEIPLPIYDGYVLRIPDLLEVHNLFSTGGYDRVVCSTEGMMGLFALYLKHAYSVEASFYLHTDWLMFARKILRIEGRNLNRIRRILRLFYQAFDRVLVLNADQKAWLSGGRMNLPAGRICCLSRKEKEAFRHAAIERTTVYHPDVVLDELLKAVGSGGVS
jgi:hypothetical protein